MMSVRFVRCLIVVMLTLPLCWDWYVVLRGHTELTITDVFRRWAKEQPLLPFFLGGVTIHLVWFTVAEFLNGGPLPPVAP